jgi:hypothetical protein
MSCAYSGHRDTEFGFRYLELCLYCMNSLIKRPRNKIPMQIPNMSVTIPVHIPYQGEFRYQISWIVAKTVNTVPIKPYITNLLFLYQDCFFTSPTKRILSVLNSTLQQNI